MGIEPRLGSTTGLRSRVAAQLSQIGFGRRDRGQTSRSFPKRSTTTEAAARLLLLVNAVYIIRNSVSAVRLLIDGRSSLYSGTELSSAEVRTIVIVVVVVMFVPFHLWVFAIGQRLLRRQRWTRWAITVTLAPFVLWSLSNALGPGLSIDAWLTLAANTAIVGLLWHPRTGRDVWWADKARLRPDYVEERPRSSIAPSARERKKGA